ncbi:hypothetical protein M9H77_03043 [Catharanthus roseus]|uniref:Uncharacterized protein n=1 Tax=Catharanthus roseus TaxID=4058 RepID=A0ACC0CA50_CATRO|nr:hypothetical protein M9H77_03043 [Catharanthus roseus]
MKEESLPTSSIKAINFFPSNSYLSFEIYFKEIKNFQDKGRNIEKELGNFLKDLPISLSLNPSFMCYTVSLVEIELFLESYLSHVRIIGNVCVITFGGGLFLVVSSTSKYVSSCDPLKNQLVNNDVSGEPSCFDYEFVHDDSFFDAKVELLLKDFENPMRANLELFKLNPLAFAKSNLRKVDFEQVCKGFIVGHLYYRRPINERNAKLYANLGNDEFCVENGTSLGYVNKFEAFDDEEQACMLFIISIISKDYSREQFGCEREQCGFLYDLSKQYAAINHQPHRLLRPFGVFSEFTRVC